MVADRARYPRLLATNGLEAVEAYTNPPLRRPDVILLDLNMPIMNGFEAARQIRQFEKSTNSHPPAVIVAITGLGDDVARARAYQNGFDFFMSKPVRPRDVMEMLEGILKGRGWS
jgi:CheY-like chemotaxis protein